MVDIISPVIDILKAAGPTFKKYVKYQFRHQRYVHEFKKMQGDLENRLKDVESRLEAQRNHQPGRMMPANEVNAWLEEARRKIAMKAEDLICKGGCFTFICSSRKLDKEKELIGGIYMTGERYTTTTATGDNLVIHNPSFRGVPLIVEGCSFRDDTQQKILELLKEDKVTRIAVSGMGGVGKTTIMRQVHNQLLKESKFNKVFWVKVSKDFDIIVQQKTEFDILKFQKRIASTLEIKLEPEDHENGTKLSQLISQRLGQGSNVLILDDVWQQFSPEVVGIPDLVENNGCKLVLTTRLQDIARAMGCNVIPVNPLPPDDALALFLEKVGSDVLSDGRIKRDIEPFLEQILHKCDGVPLAIVIVAKTMKGKLDPRSWKWAFSKLSKFEEIIHCLKFSYECLESQCQKCFLYCALYPEDYVIPREELIECWIEEGFIYKEGETRDIMNCEGHVMLEKLVDNCLLESVKNEYEEDCVSMHDLLREMALDIKPKFLVKAGMGLEKLPEEHEWRKDLLKVSLMNNYMIGIPSSMPSPKCPMLTTLLLSGNHISTIPEAFFEHMPKLKILDLSDNPRLSWLTSSISKLEKLTTLLLGGCVSLRKVPSLSNFGDLKKLDLSRTPIEEVPQGLNMLTNLKYLCLGRELFRKGFHRIIDAMHFAIMIRPFEVHNGLAGGLSEIPDGLLQTLSKLQHLEVDYNVPLKGEEIGRLGKLEHVKGRFSTLNEIGIFFNYREKFLNMYNVFVGSYNVRNFGQAAAKLLIDMKSKTIWCCDIDICGGPKWLPSDVKQLFICNCKVVRSLNDISGFQGATDLRFVLIENCDGMEYGLVRPWLDSLQNVEEVRAVAKSAPLPASAFSSLEKILVCRCDKMKKLFSIRWLGYLQSLKTIEVAECEQIEEIIWSDYEEGEKALEKVALPKLESLKLRHLPQLKSIYSGFSTVLICDSIKKIEIDICGNIESLFSSRFNPLPTLEHLNLNFIKNLKLVFDEEALGLSPPLITSFSLKRINVSRCDQLKKVFSSGWLLSYFQFLETLKVENCEQMEELISSSAHEEENVTLPRLQSLKLTNLPQLKSIYSNSNNVLICDSIESLKIVNCERLKRIPLDFPLLDNTQSSHPPSLKEIVVFPKEWWESLEWDHPNAKDILLPFCEFPLKSRDIEESSSESNDG